MIKPIIDKKKIMEVFERGLVADIIPSKDELLKFLFSGGHLKIYIGADPTFTSLHLGHAGNYMFLEDLRDLGHEVIVLIGDFTARIGDPSGRTTARVPLTDAQIKENMKGWVSQLKPILSFSDKKNPVRVVYNSAWLGKLKFADILQLASQFTVQQMIERDMFEKRWKENIPIHLHEFLYPIMQGYDSVALDVNAELCGTDQLFNALAGRTLLKRLKNKEKFVITLNLLQNPKTGEMMSKSRGTGVFLSALPNDMYGALMAQPDEMTEALFINCTRIPLAQKDAVLALGPKAAKERVAFEIVKIMHGEKAAMAAQENFEKLFSKHEMPEDLPELKLTTGEMAAIDVVLLSGVVKSRGEARRLIEQGGFEISGKVVKDFAGTLDLKDGEAIKIGKKRFFRLCIT
jgi:tyrosyl-tRNA synthetase